MRRELMTIEELKKDNELQLQTKDAQASSIKREFYRLKGVVTEVMKDNRTRGASHKALFREQLRPPEPWQNQRTSLTWRGAGDLEQARRAMQQSQGAAAGPGGQQRGR